MKHIFKLLLLSLVIISFWSCEKDEKRITFEGGTPPVLTASATGNIPMSFAAQNQQALKLSWTNPNYQFTTGISSQNVTYLVEIDTVGANFTNPKRKTISVSNDLGLTMTVGELNDYLLNQLELVPGIPHNIEIRVKSFLGNNAVMLTSNSLQFTVTPYAIPPKVAPPASGQLYIVGSATPGDWSNPVPVPSQRFTQLSPTMYEITLSLNGGGSYLFLPVNGDWSAKYGAMGANNSNNPDGDDFKAGGGDMLAPAVSGTYKIEVNFQTGKFKLTKL